MDIIGKITDVARRIASLERGVQEAISAAQRVEDKLDRIIERLATLEVEGKSLRENVKNQILADIKGDMAVVQERLRVFELDQKSTSIQLPQSVK